MILKPTNSKKLDILRRIISFFISLNKREAALAARRDFYLILFVTSLACLMILVFGSADAKKKIVNPFISPLSKLSPVTVNKNKKEVFGFAPYWTFDKVDNTDFDVLTTLAYFGVPVDTYGNLDKNDPGYATFTSKRATEVFTKAHAHGTRVVLTITQMDNYSINSVMESEEAQANVIDQTVSEVEKRGIDGINVDFEYTGDPGPEYRNRFTNFVKNITEEMHRRVPSSRVTVSVYAGSVRDPKIYDIQALANVSDGIFMMAYDFAPSGADNAIPTAPLHGYKEGKYWYDIATAVDDFLAVMPSEKLILGVPWYSYNYAVYEPKIKAPTFWNGVAQTYAAVQDNINANVPGISQYKTGWDEAGKVAWKSYYDENYGTWRIVFFEDVRSLGYKFDFAKNKNLGGVGIWALGFEDGKKDVWKLLEEKFGAKLADSIIIRRAINEISI